MKRRMQKKNPHAADESVSNDPRVRKEGASLVRVGYEVVVIGVKSGEFPYSEQSMATALLVS